MDSNQDNAHEPNKEPRAEGQGTFVIDYARITPESALHYRKEAVNRKTARRHEIEEEFARRVFARVGADSHVVDIPCGNGRFFEVFGAAKQVTMLDISENMIQAARHWIGERKNTRIDIGDIFSISVPSGTADLCFCMRLFHHMDTDTKRLAALKELTRVSKRFVALSFYNKNCVRYRRRQLLGKAINGQYTTYANMVALARQAGLVPEVRIPRVNLFEQQCLILFSKA